MLKYYYDCAIEAAYMMKNHYVLIHGAPQQSDQFIAKAALFISHIWIIQEDSYYKFEVQSGDIIKDFKPNSDGIRVKRSNLELYKGKGHEIIMRNSRAFITPKVLKMGM